MWKKLTSNIKAVANTTSFTHRLKKEILSKLQFHWFVIIYLFIYLFIWHLIFFTIFLCVHTSKGTLMEIRMEYFTLAMLLFYLIILLRSLFICILNIFDSEINIYIHINCELIHITTNLYKTSYWPLTTL